MQCDVDVFENITDTFRTGNTYVCLIESQLKGVKNARNNSRCLVIIIYCFLNSEVLLNKSVRNLMS